MTHHSNTVKSGWEGRGLGGSGCWGGGRGWGEEAYCPNRESHFSDRNFCNASIHSPVLHHSARPPQEINKVQGKYSAIKNSNLRRRRGRRKRRRSHFCFKHHAIRLKIGHTSTNTHTRTHTTHTHTNTHTHTYTHTHVTHTHIQTNTHTHTHTQTQPVATPFQVYAWRGNKQVIK